MNLVPTTVNPSGLTELIRNLGRDCLPTQFIREFTKNAFEACQRTGESDCEVVVDFDQNIFERNEEPMWKICFIDTGDGMSAAQMRTLLNSLSASGDARNEHKNYGVGAKIAALTRNHAGIIYESWKDGVGHRVFIRYDPENDIYGIQRFEVNGEYLECIPLPSCKLDAIAKKGHGTKVTLLGMQDAQDTMLPPGGVGGIRESWLVLYLNSRYFEIPDCVSLKARIGYYRENNPRHNYLFNVSGQKYTLDRSADLSGVKQLEGAKLYWWVMPKKADGHGREMLKGHTGLINQGEIFDVSDGRSNRITFFGVVFGRDRVVIYLEPANAHQNTARTGLVNEDGSPISWHEWCDEFRADIPEDLKAWLLEQEQEYAVENHTDSIKERLKSLKNLFKLGRYKPDTSGKVFADPDTHEEHSTSNLREGEDKDEPETPEKENSGEKTGDLASQLMSDLLNEEVGVKASEVSPDPFPKVNWIEASNGYLHLTDRAAEYLPQQHMVFANSEFQGVRDVIDHLQKSYRDLPEVRQIIEDEVRYGFEQALMECVAGAVSFRNRKHWDSNQSDAAVSPEALTAAVMPRYWMISHIRRVLAARIKAFAAAE